MRHCYALLSGGLDSTLAILAIVSKNEPVEMSPVFFDYGQKAREEESRAVRQLVPIFRKRTKHPESRVHDCRFFNIAGSDQGLFSWSQSAILTSRPHDGDVDLENRNMVLLSCVASIFMADRKASQVGQSAELVTGFLNEHYDTRLPFVSAFEDLFEAMGQQIKVTAPLIPQDRGARRVSRDHLVHLAHSLDAYSLLKDNTWSCYYPQLGKPCECCPACGKRADFFQELGMKKVKNKPRRPLS